MLIQSGNLPPNVFQVILNAFWHPLLGYLFPESWASTPDNHLGFLRHHAPAFCVLFLLPLCRNHYIIDHTLLYQQLSV